MLTAEIGYTFAPKKCTISDRALGEAAMLLSVALTVQDGCDIEIGSFRYKPD